MDINAATLSSIFTGLSTAFNQRFEAVENQYATVAMTVPSTSSSNEYPRLDDLPGIREWIGDRVLHDLSAQTYTIRNRDFEGAIKIKRSQIEDDNIGIYSSVASDFGQQSKEFPDQLIFPLLKRGHETICYDGQNFFDTDHPGYDEAGNVISVSNYQPGAGPAWFLIDDTRSLKPMIYQQRRTFSLVSQMNETDPNVFNQGVYVWGVDGRGNAGFGLWQLAYMSRAPLTVESYLAARNAMTGIRKRSGQPINIRPSRLVVPRTLEADARQLLNAQLVNGGDSNVWFNSAELSVIDRLN
ncbi:MAG: Mu-like prophage major head subunit gpT family protein [Ahrensia sp.]|nr:Mu-like prophage major head subunit gpT family protein [Ahrensia sp.]